MSSSAEENPSTANEMTNESHQTAELLDQAFNQFKTYIDGRLNSITSDIKATEHSGNQAMQPNTKKVQREAEAQKLKYKANSKQYLHNAEVQDLLEDLVHHLDRENPNVNQALAEAHKAVAAIQKRQKLIKIADKSEAGWMAVDEYETDELADDSADEKRIRKAQDKAVRKKKQMVSNRAKRMKSNYESSAVVDSRDRQLFRGNVLISFNSFCSLW